jgi:hypothetical protein
MTPQAHWRFARNALVAAVLPIAFAVVNQRLTSEMVHSYDRNATILAAVVLLIELAAFGWLCGRFVEPRSVQWAGYIWMWLVADAVIIPLATDGVWWGYPMALVLPAILSVQLSLIALWTVLGNTAWPVRWPLGAAALTLGSCYPLRLHQSGTNTVSIVAAAETVALVVVLLGIRGRGVRICDTAHPAATSPSKPRARFSLGNALLWITLVAIVLSAARALDLFTPSYVAFTQRETRFQIIIGLWSGAVVAALTWAMLGTPRRVPWWVLTIAAAVASVVLLPAVYYQLAMRSVFSRGIGWGPFPFWSRPFWRFFYDYKWPLIAWILLSPTSMAAALVFYRAAGYRLIREGRPKPATPPPPAAPPPPAIPPLPALAGSAESPRSG